MMAVTPPLLSPPDGARQMVVLGRGEIHLLPLHIVQSFVSFGLADGMEIERTVTEPKETKTRRVRRQWSPSTSFSLS